MSKYESNYQTLLRRAIHYGHTRKDRTGVGSRSIFSQHLEVDISTHFPMITGKKLFFKNIETEFKWFINGETNIKRFQDNNVTIWDHWADLAGNLGPVYGHQMINFSNSGHNQLSEVIESIKSDPDSRRHIITLWNPLQTKYMALPACYHNFNFFTETMNGLSVHVLMRSADLFIGVPYDIALFSLFLTYVAKETGRRPSRVHVTFVDAHVYSNQHQQISEYLSLNTHKLPQLEYQDENNFKLINYQSNHFIKTPLAI